jgi:purine-binding chemotaxis protein CheW
MIPLAGNRNGSGQSLDIIAFRLRDQEFCVKTTTIREIRGWAPSTPIPHAPPEVVGVMNLRGSIIPIIDLARKLGMPGTEADQRSAIVVAEVGSMVVGLLVDRVSDILTVSPSQIQPVPEVAASLQSNYSEGIIVHGDSMICFLDLSRMFTDKQIAGLAA